jgi:hypothetical protein
MKNTVSLKSLAVFAISCISFNLLAQINETGLENAVNESYNLSPRYPTKIISRPGIMPPGIINFDTSANLSGLETLGLKIGTQFGIVKDLEGQFSYDGVEFNKKVNGEYKPFQEKRTVNLGAKYRYFSLPHVGFSVTASLPIHVFDGEIIRDITFGFPIGFGNDLMAGGILGDLFHLTMRENVALDFSFPIWYGIQVYGDLWAQIDTSLGQVKMENENNQAKWSSTFFWQKLEAKLSAAYAFNHYVDLGFNFGFKDVFEPKETMEIGLTLSVRGGNLFS